MAGPRHIAVFRWLVLLSAVPIGCVALYFLRDELSLQRLAEHDEWARQFYNDHPVVITFVAFAGYVAATGASVPGAVGMTLACGWLFGFWRALILVSIASTAGASLAFMVTRLVLRDRVRERFADRLKEVESALERDGAFYLFLLRLVPVIPFFVVNIVMGLTPIRLRTFWCVSQLGMLPGTVLYVAIGASVPTLRELADQGITGVLTADVVFTISAAFTALGLLPLIARRIIVRRHARMNSSGREP